MSPLQEALKDVADSKHRLANIRADDIGPAEHARRVNAARNELAAAEARVVDERKRAAR